MACWWNRPAAAGDPAFATNGINLIGFGAESTLMAGADIAVARDTSALNTNPVGLTQIRGQAFDGCALKTLYQRARPPIPSCRLLRP